MTAQPRLPKTLVDFIRAAITTNALPGETESFDREQQREAAEFIARYFARYPGVQSYIAGGLRDARDAGITKTMFGRLRQHPEINSKNGLRRSMAERTAINSPIQGTAADIIKIAMIRVADYLKAQKLRTRMVLQVHDELIFEVPEKEVAATLPVVQHVMQDAPFPAVLLSVPLQVDARAANNWDEAH